MPRKARQPHELSLRNHKGQAVCTYRTKTFAFGPWLKATKELPGGKPSADAMANFQRQVGIWSQHPDAGLFVEQEATDFLAMLWRDWIASPHRSGDCRLVAQAGVLLFGTAEEPGPHRATDATTFTPADLLAWQSALCWLKELDTEGNPTARSRYGRRVVMRLVSLVKRCYQWAAVVGRVDPDRAAAIKLVPGPAKGEARLPVRVPAVPDEIVTTTLPHLPPPPRAAVQVLRLCGARPAEVLDLRCGDIVRSGVCWAGGTVPLDLDELGVWAAVKSDHKNQWRGGDRVIFLGKTAQAVLMPLLCDDPTVPIFSPAAGRAHAVARNKAKRKPGNYGTYKKPKGANGKKLNATYTADSLNQAVERACDAAGVPRWTPKQLRKTCLGFVQARFGAEAASAVGGHAAVGVTQRFYTGADYAAAARAMAELG